MVLVRRLRDRLEKKARALPDQGLDVARVRSKVTALATKCRERNILFDFRPRVHTRLMNSYCRSGRGRDGRCLAVATADLHRWRAIAMTVVHG